ncbi:MAG: TRAP transporter large permease [Gammaproteobacteria bacterium]
MLHISVLPFDADGCADGSKIHRFGQCVESGLLIAALTAIVLLPLSEASMRLIGKSGIPGVSATVQHLVLVVSLIGAVIASRQDRLLSLSSLHAVLPCTWIPWIRAFSKTVSIAVSLWLAWSGWKFVEVESALNTHLAFGIPVWWIQAVMPAGFFMISLHLAFHAGGAWPERMAAVVASLVLAWTINLLQSESAAFWMALQLGVLMAATVLGAPLFVTLGGASLIFFMSDDLPVAALALNHYQLVINPILPSLPLFTLAGYFLAESRAPERLIRVFNGMLGSVRGGSVVVSVLLCVFFTCFTGASGVTILALGGLLMPLLVSTRFSGRNALGLITAAPAAGILLPPALPVILYAVVAEQDIRAMFAAALIPGLMIAAMLMFWGVYRSPTQPCANSYDGGKVAPLIWHAKWELLLPVVTGVSLFSGFATPVEAASITACYAFVSTVLIHRDLKPRDLPRVVTECGVLIGGVLLILGVALGLTNFMVDAEVPGRLVDLVKRLIESPVVFLIGLNLFLLLTGCLMDIFSAIVVVAPLIIPLGSAFGVDPLHLGVIFLANLELGYLTPPVGMNLFFSSYRFNKSMYELYRAVMPVYPVLLAGVMLITFVPSLSSYLPSLLNH